MFSVFKNISSKKKSILLIALILVIAIAFETFQQLYYINRYNIAQNVSFFDLLKTQSQSWIIWVLVSIPLMSIAKLNSKKDSLSISNYLKSFLSILGLVFLSILLISITQLLRTEATFSFKYLISEYIPFFTFQKALIFTLGYIAITIILHYYFANEQLLVKVEELIKVKNTHTDLYNKLRKDIDDKASILNIKIGNKRKIIAVEHIYWIEADDYCVKVHTENDDYTMRSSLKALEEKLGSNFLRIHRKAIANMNKVTEYNLSNTPTLTLENRVKVPISKSNLKAVRGFIS